VLGQRLDGRRHSDGVLEGDDGGLDGATDFSDHND
jgi:hypothetical protein